MNEQNNEKKNKYFIHPKKDPPPKIQKHIVECLCEAISQFKSVYIVIELKR